MITEDYVSFETAKLLKEKGFKIPYNSFRGVYINGIFKRLNPGDGYGYNLGDEIVEVCSLQMAMKWLREKHNLFVFPFPQMNTNKFWVEIFQLSNNQEWENLYCESIDLQDYPLYEEATEAGIKYCLENLI